MTRPLTKAQLKLLALPDSRQSEAHCLRFIVGSMVRGATLGMFVATFVLMTDMFGLLTLMVRQSDPIATAGAFMVGGVMIFTPLWLAVAVGSAGRRK